MSLIEQIEKEYKDVNFLGELYEDLNSGEKLGIRIGAILAILYFDPQNIFVIHRWIKHHIALRHAELICKGEKKMLIEVKSTSGFKDMTKSRK